MAYLCVPPSGSPVTLAYEKRALEFASRGWIVTDLDAVEDEAAPAKPRSTRKPKAPAPE